MKLTVQAILLSLLKQSYKSKEKLLIIYWGVGGWGGGGVLSYSRGSNKLCRVTAYSNEEMLIQINKVKLPF